MSDQLPYNEEQWSDLPLPDGEVAWQKMELLLDKEKKRRMLPFWWRLTGLTVLLVGVSTGVWLWFGKDEKAQETSSATLQQSIKKASAPKDEVDNRKQIQESVEKSKKATTNISPSNNPSSVNKRTTTTEVTTGGKNLANDITTDVVTTSSSLKEIAKRGYKKTTLKVPQQRSKISTSIVSTAVTEEKRPTSVEERSLSKTDGNKSIQPAIALTNNDSTTKEDKPNKDTLIKVALLPTTNDSTKKQKTKQAGFVWSAGIGLQQAIAVNGQQSSSYNYNGKKATLSDRLPSVYVRLQKGKLFAQAEFQYGVPQPVSNFAFSQKTKFDAASSSINTERFTIQKLYYHQLPVSVNYHIVPNLSIGVGGMYNILAGAVTEREVQSKNVQTGNETSTKNLAPVKGFKDSFLYKTTAGVLVQADYHWKRFSLGLRFTQNLQPFIKYTKPDGTLIDEKTNALQAILRFKLWSGK